MVMVAAAPNFDACALIATIPVAPGAIESKYAFDATLHMDETFAMLPESVEYWVLTHVLISSYALIKCATFARMVYSWYCGKATAAKMPMMATTIISSTRVKPFWILRFIKNSRLKNKKSEPRTRGLRLTPCQTAIPKLGGITT